MWRSREWSRSRGNKVISIQNAEEMYDHNGLIDRKHSSPNRFWRDDNQKYAFKFASWLERKTSLPLKWSCRNRADRMCGQKSQNGSRSPSATDWTRPTHSRMTWLQASIKQWQVSGPLPVNSPLSVGRTNGGQQKRETKCIQWVRQLSDQQSEEKKKSFFLELTFLNRI